MLRIYTFINALKLRQGLDSPIPEEEGYDINAISLPAWTALVDRYTGQKLQTYSTGEMIRMGINRQLVFDFDEYLANLHKGTPHILNWKDSRSRISKVPQESHATDDILKGFLYDNVVYNRCTIWYLTDGENIKSRELLFESPGQALWYRSRGFSPEDALTEEFLEFAKNKLYIPLIYKMLPEGNKYVKRIFARI